MELAKPSFLEEKENHDLIDLQPNKPIDGKYPGVCFGDSGSGTFAKSTSNDKYYLIAVNSKRKTNLVILVFIKMHRLKKYKFNSF